MKAILVIDVGENVDFKKDFAKVRLFTSNGINIRYYSKVKLQPMPQKIDANDWHRMFDGTYSEREAKGHGYNACLKEILGDE